MLRQPKRPGPPDRSARIGGADPNLDLAKPGREGQHHGLVEIVSAGAALDLVEEVE